MADRFALRRWWKDIAVAALSSVRIRLADGERFEPDGSPPDVGTPPPARRR